MATSDVISDPVDTFDAKTYLNRRFTTHNGIIDEQRGVQPFYLKSYHDFYQTFHHEWDHNKARLVEIGGGPVIYPLISAAPYVSDITFADYAEVNLEQIKLWVNSDSRAHNWNPYFSHVVGTLEGNSDPARGAMEREELLKKKIKCIVPCDIRVKHPQKIIDGGSNSLEPFDIVAFNFCAEAVCMSIQEYQETLSKLAMLVKPSGYLTSLISLEESWYINEGGKTFVLCLTSETVHDCFKKAGFSVQCSEVFSIPEESQNLINDCKGILFIAAKKNN